MRAGIVGLLALGVAGSGGCRGSDGAIDTSDDTGDGGACGDVTTWDVEVLGAIVAADGTTPVAGATVTVEDRAWNAGSVLGEATSGGDGTFSLDATGVTSVEGCWATALDYWLVATDGTRSGERGINSSLYDAITASGGVADLTAAPLAIE